MCAVAGVTAWAMLVNLVDYYKNFEDLWLLSISGTLILALDVWILVEGFSALHATRPDMAPAT